MKDYKKSPDWRLHKRPGQHCQTSRSRCSLPPIVALSPVTETFTQFSRLKLVLSLQWTSILLMSCIPRIPSTENIISEIIMTDNMGLIQFVNVVSMMRRDRTRCANSGRSARSARNTRRTRKLETSSILNRSTRQSARERDVIACLRTYDTYALKESVE
jgi:hypothetical protein